MPYEAPGLENPLLEAMAGEPGPSGWRFCPPWSTARPSALVVKKRTPAVKMVTISPPELPQTRPTPLVPCRPRGYSSVVPMTGARTVGSDCGKCFG